jgi:diguanylate cyclase (GGDEF)-like protein
MNDRRADLAEARKEARVRFEAPTVAAAARPPALVYIAGTVLAAVACVLLVHVAPIWPAPYQLATTLAFVAVITLFNSFGAFERYGEFARYVGLDGPVVLALLFVVDWKFYVLGVVLAETGIFITEAARKINPTIWYLRVFNPSEYVIAGAAATCVLRTVWQPGNTAYLAWNSPIPFEALLLAVVLWKILDIVQTHVCLALATDARLDSLHIAPVQLAGEFAVLFAAVPLALLWTTNVWLAMFAFASIAGGSVLLHVSETEHRLHIDERTGLTNAAAFDTQFGNALAEAARQKRTFALLVIDIDHFKSVNDEFGHDLGDRVIVWFANQLASHARSIDLLARVGGEEFALLMHDTGRTDAVALGERLRNTIAETPYLVNDATPLTVTTSVGIAMFPTDGEETRELFRSADAALYDAKRAGRNLVRTAPANRGR